MWIFFRDKKIFSRIHLRYDRLVNSNFFAIVYFDGWTAGLSWRTTLSGQIFFYGYLLSAIILIVNLFITVFLKVGDKRTYADYLHFCRTHSLLRDQPFMTVLSPEEASQMIPFTEFLDSVWFQLFFGCSLVLAKCFFFFFIIFWCIFLFKFCAFGPDREKALFLANNFVSTRIYAFFYALFIFFAAVLVLFLIPGVDDFFLARQYVPPLRWIYVDFTTYFHGYVFYTGHSWTNSRVWMPNTYGSHISYFFLHAQNIPAQEITSSSQFVIDLQLKTFYKEMNIYLESFPRLFEITDKERTMFYFVHKDPSVIYDILETLVKVDKFICDVINKFREK